MARKTTGTPGRSAGAKDSPARRPDQPAGETASPTPPKTTGTAAKGTSPDTPAPDATGSGGTTPASKPESASARPATPATAAVDLGTAKQGGSGSDAPAAGAMPAVKRTSRADAETAGSASGPASGPEATTGKTGPAAASKPTSEPSRPQPASPSAERPAKGGSGLGAGLIGGLVGAGLVLGAGWIWLSQTQNTEELESRLAALEREIAPIEDGLDGLRAETETNLSDLDGRLGTTETGLADLGARMDAFDTRLSQAEASAGPDGTLAREAVARWQEEVDALRADLETQAQEIAGMAERAAEEVATAGRTAEQIEAEAAATAARARARATLAEIEAALETGEPYPALLEELQATSPAEIPQPLSGPAADGVASRSELIEAFPEPARAALALARREGLSGEEGGRVAGFFRDTLQLRSTAPSEGETTDAVLSRAEAALRDGRLQAALDEIAALPEPVREALSEWVVPARTRAEALAAADTLSQSLTEN